MLQPPESVFCLYFVCILQNTDKIQAHYRFLAVMSRVLVIQKKNRNANCHAGGRVRTWGSICYLIFFHAGPEAIQKQWPPPKAHGPFLHNLGRRTASQIASLMQVFAPWVRLAHPAIATQYLLVVTGNGLDETTQRDPGPPVAFFNFILLCGESVGSTFPGGSSNSNYVYS